MRVHRRPCTSPTLDGYRGWVVGWLFQKTLTERTDRRMGGKGEERGLSEPGDRSRCIGELCTTDNKHQFGQGRSYFSVQGWGGRLIRTFLDVCSYRQAAASHFMGDSFNVMVVSMWQFRMTGLRLVCRLKYVMDAPAFVTKCSEINMANCRNGIAPQFLYVFNMKTGDTKCIRIWLYCKTQ